MGTKSSCVTHNFYITTTSGIKQIWEQSPKSELQIGLKKLLSERWISLSMPLFNLEIYFDKVLKHPWDFLGKSTGVGCHRLLCYNSQVGLVLAFFDFVDLSRSEEHTSELQSP